MGKLDKLEDQVGGTWEGGRCVGGMEGVGGEGGGEGRRRWGRRELEWKGGAKDEGVGERGKRWDEEKEEEEEGGHLYQIYSLIGAWRWES